ncbi:nucleotidyltransferase domain-containing protein [uncultured Bacteroides sp.]|uniref:nucleotidyltransferase domain-containing protein n=1 Tax=uncultured Bacteroides sp. TaxID=162156 RepID=UPI0025E24A30|nr:nucleotidyltransferase domain-containing protein [uncultured Bacteroides sp.]
MRLQTKEIEIIRKVAREIYGEGVRVYLFGSRLDDTKRGGDIDLLVRTTTAKRGVLERIRMIARLKQYLGDQKIDVVGDYEESSVVYEALKKGVLLV